jgi:predicted Zn-dependent protease
MRLASVLFALVVFGISLPGRSWGQSIIRDAEIEAVVRDWADPIFKAAGLRPEDINIHIINDGSMNAFVTRGQNMFLHTGIILNADTPNELIGVMAHETGHMAGGHLARSDDAMSKAMRPVILTMGLGILAALAGAPDAGAAIIGSAQKNGTVTFYAYTRVLEASTDQAAENYMEATGQSGRGLLSFFQRFRYNEVLSGATRYPYFLSHPLSSERINSLEVRVEESPYKDVVDSPEDIHKLEMIKAKITGFLEDPSITFSKYPEEDTSLPARYARAIANHQAAKTSLALKQIGDLLTEEPDNPYFNELYGQILFETGKARKAIPYHQRAVELRPQSALLKLNLSQDLIATEFPENTGRAIALLKEVVARETDNSFAWYELSIAYEQQGNIALAKLATAEQAYAMGDYGRAQSFAQRALVELPQGTPDWRRANDITLVIASDPSIRKRMAQRRH